MRSSSIWITLGHDLGLVGLCLGPPWDMFGMALGRVWGDFGLCLLTLWDMFRVTLGYDWVFGDQV